MFDCQTDLSTLRRPRLLMRAARIGLADYRRARDLRRVLPETGEGPALPDLIELEARIDSARAAGLATYSPLRHVEVLIALLAEWQLTRTPE